VPAFRATLDVLLDGVQVLGFPFEAYLTPAAISYQHQPAAVAPATLYASPDLSGVAAPSVVGIRTHDDALEIGMSGASFGADTNIILEPGGFFTLVNGSLSNQQVTARPLATTTDVETVLAGTTATL